MTTASSSVSREGFDVSLVRQRGSSAFKQFSQQDLSAGATFEIAGLLANYDEALGITIKGVGDRTTPTPPIIRLAYAQSNPVSDNPTRLMLLVLIS